MTSAEFVQHLRWLRWEVETVYEHGVDKEKDDARLIAWARTFGFVFLSFDKFRADQGIRVAEEIRLRGGKVIVIAGGPNQPVERSLGKLLFHHPQWHADLSLEDGWVKLGDIGASIKFTSRSALQERHIQLRGEQLNPYLERRAAGGRKRSPKRRKVPKEQGNLYLPGGA